MLPQGSHKTFCGGHLPGIGANQVLRPCLVNQGQVAQIGLQFLAGTLGTVRNAIVCCRDLQLRVHDGETGSADRLYLTGDCRADGNGSVLKGLVNVVVTGPNVIGQFRVIHCHGGSILLSDTEAFQHSAVDGRILHELLDIDLQLGVELQYPLVVLFRLFSKRSAKAVHDALPLGGFIHILGNDRTNAVRGVDHRGELDTGQSLRPCPGAGSGLVHSAVVAVCAGNNPLNFRGESREAIGNLLHFIGKRLHGSGQIFHLPGELINVRLFQLVNHPGQLPELIDEAGQMCFVQFGQGAQTISQTCQFIPVRPL